MKNLLFPDYRLSGCKLVFMVQPDLTVHVLFLSYFLAGERNLLHSVYLSMFYVGRKSLEKGIEVKVLYKKGIDVCSSKKKSYSEIRFLL